MTKNVSSSSIRRVVVTTKRKPSKAQEIAAKQVASELEIPFVSRNDRSILRLKEDESKATGHTLDAVLVAGGSQPRLHLPNGVFYYHPGMGVNRLRQIRLGREDWMLKAMDLSPGQHVLDATLGIGSDLLVASHTVGAKGRAVGLESEPLLWYIVREGMANYTHSRDDVTQALRRIEAVNVCYQKYLATAPDDSFDVVYFDPMFQDPVEESHHMDLLRPMANMEHLTLESIQEAARVARRRVVVKDRREGPYAKSGWFDQVVGSHRSRICYGILIP